MENDTKANLAVAVAIVGILGGFIFFITQELYIYTVVWTATTAIILGMVYFIFYLLLKR